MKTFVMLDSHTLPADFHQEKEILARNGHACVLAECADDDAAVLAAADAEVIGVCYFKVTADLLDRLPKLKAVIRYGIGYDVVDVDACSARGVMLCNLPTFCVTDVATHAMAMLLDMCRKLTVYDRQARKGNWDVGHGYPVHRLGTMTLGLIGFGNTARLLTGYVRPFGMRVIAFDPAVDAETVSAAGAEKAELADVFAQADAISVHVPSIPATRHMINKESISTMKDGVMIINTARGPIINLNDLIEALQSGKVRAAGLDVFEGEPLTDLSHPIYGCETCIITPHSAYNSAESEEDQHTQVAETAVRIFAGEMPPNTVNRSQLTK